MCYGSLDPKYLMRDIEARVKHLSYEQDTKKRAAPAPQAGLFARLRGVVDVLLRKDPGMTNRKKISIDGIKVDGAMAVIRAAE